MTSVVGESGRAGKGGRELGKEREREKVRERGGGKEEGERGKIKEAKVSTSDFRIYWRIGLS